MKHPLFLPLLLLTVSLLIGCNKTSKPDDLPVLYPCKFTVIQDGKPLTDALVIFRPVEGVSRFSMGGKTDSNGVIVPKLDGAWEGLPNGEFCVSVSKIIPSDLEQPDRDTPLAKRRAMNAAIAKETKETVDPQFSDLVKTTLRVTVSGSKVEEQLDVGQAVNISMSELHPGRVAL